MTIGNASLWICLVEEDQVDLVLTGVFATAIDGVLLRRCWH